MDCDFLAILRSGVLERRGGAATPISAPVKVQALKAATRHSHSITSKF